METKHYVALIIVVAMTCGSLLLQLLSLRARDWAFFAIVVGSVLVDRIDVNFLGEYWYRGTSRGIELSALDTLAWGLLIASVLAPRYERRRWLWPASTAFLLLYFGWAAWSITEAPKKIWALWEVANIPRAMLFLFTGALFVRTQRELRVLVLALCTTVGIETVFGLKHHFIMGLYRVPGTLDHPNSLSMYLCTVGPVCLAGAFCDWPKWLRWICGLSWAAAGALVVATISRAGIPIFGVVTLGVALACSTWRITRLKVAIVSGSVAIFGAVLFKAWPYIMARYESASFAEEYLEVDGENRGVYWRWADMMVHDHPYGVGMNNWSYMVSKRYGFLLGFTYEDYDDIAAAPEKADLPSMTYAPPAHSLAALTIGELGWPGIILFSLLWLRWFQMGASFLRYRLNPNPMHRLGIGLLFGTLGIFLQSTTEWTYRQQTMLITFHIMAGTLAALYYARQHATRAPVAPLEEDAEADAETIAALPVAQRS